MSFDYLWNFLPLGFALTVLIESPILWFGLSARHPPFQRLLAGLWLTACTYPFVVLIFPSLISPTTDRFTYLLVAESFAPLAECVIFWGAFCDNRSYCPALVRDFAAITLANLASFGVGEGLHRLGWL